MAGRTGRKRWIDNGPIKEIEARVMTKRARGEGCGKDGRSVALDVRDVGGERRCCVARSGRKIKENPHYRKPIPQAMSFNPSRHARTEFIAVGDAA
jgi:hypothetical protein